MKDQIIKIKKDQQEPIFLSKEYAKLKITNKENNKGIKMNNKINNEKFLKNINVLIEDMTRVGSENFVNELRDIADKKCVTPLNTQTLIPFLQYRKNNPSHYIKEIQHGLSVGLNFKELLIDTNQLEKDHLYMYNILLDYLEWQETDFGMFVISKKYGEVA